jgi:signal transduction histidine kinase
VRAAGVPVQLSVQGDPQALPEGIQLAVFRVAQEALTNTLKHADASAAHVQLRYIADALELQVLDDGHGATPLNGETGGQGLIGMRERVTLFGGELTAGPRSDRGYEVRARLPLEETKP